MPPAQSPYLFLAVFALVAMIFPLIPLTLAWLWARFYSPQKSGPVKNATYECGLVATGDSWIRVRVHYYHYAIVFLIVDVESVFLLPFAVVHRHLALGPCLAMLVFVLLVVEGIVWAWSRGHLEWK